MNTANLEQGLTPPALPQTSPIPWIHPGPDAPQGRPPYGKPTLRRMGRLKAVAGSVIIDGDPTPTP